MTVEAIERELWSDLQQLEERFRDEKFCAELYRALTRNKWTKEGFDGHVALSFSLAEELVNAMREHIGYPPLPLAQSGDEGQLDSTIEDELIRRRGWRIEPLDTSEHDPEHVAKPAESPPPAPRERPWWEQIAHEEAERNRWRAPIRVPYEGERPGG